jgi:hypothetical protein
MVHSVTPRINNYNWHNECETWQRCVSCNRNRVPSCAARTISFSPDPNCEAVSVSPGGGQLISASSVTKVSQRPRKYVLAKFRFRG